MGSTHGMEKKICEEAKIPYEAILTGKIRRYFDWRNVADLVKIPIGVLQAFTKLLKNRPQVVFSKGGFVAFPVVVAAWMLGIPVLIHESDAIPGLATKWTAPFARRIYLGYEAAGEGLKSYRHKLEVVGNPIRLKLYEGERKRGLKWAGFDEKKPILLVAGGGSGSLQLNHLVQQEKKKLLESYDIIHIYGQGKGKPLRQKHYVAVPYIGEGIEDVYESSSLAVSRAGANTLAEWEALQIPALLYPLGRLASRGDQVVNAQELCKKSSLHHIADEGKTLVSQLKNLPKRPSRHKPSTTQKLVLTLLSDLREL